MKINGSCHCGFITIEGEADPEKVTVCHCTDCQTGTGSAFRVSVPVPGTSFKMTGKPENYVKTTADSGNPRVQAFCPKCGSPIYSTSPGEGQQASYMVRVGILQQRECLHHQHVERPPQFGQRCLDPPLVEGPQAIEQVVDLVLQREFGEDADRLRFLQSGFERLEVQRRRRRRGLHD